MKEKLATRIAHRLASDIQQKGWPVGEILGREADLIRRLKISRESFREAVQILANALRRAAVPAQAYRSRDEEAMAIGSVFAQMLEASDSPTLSMLMATLQRLIADFGHHERYPQRVWANVQTRMWALAAELLARLTQEHGHLAARHVAHSELVRLREAVRQQLAHKPTVDAALPLFRQWAFLANNRVLALIIEILATAQGRLTSGSVSVRDSLKGALTQLERALVEPNLDDFAAAICSAGMLLQQSIGGVPEPRATRASAAAKRAKVAARRPRQK